MDVLSPATPRRILSLIAVMAALTTIEVRHDRREPVCDRRAACGVLEHVRDGVTVTVSRMHQLRGALNAAARVTFPSGRLGTILIAQGVGPRP